MSSIEFLLSCLVGTATLFLGGGDKVICIIHIKMIQFYVFFRFGLGV